MRFEQTSKERSDCSASYSVTNYKSKTVGEFIREVIETRPKEWGKIKVKLEGLSWLSYPYCEYKWGEIIRDIDEKYKSLIIKSMTGDGGWTQMDYYIEVETETTETEESYNPYKVVVESILGMFNRFDPIMTDKQDFIDNIRVKCKDAVEYEELKNQMLK